MGRESAQTEKEPLLLWLSLAHPGHGSRQCLVLSLSHRLMDSFLHDWIQAFRCLVLA